MGSLEQLHVLIVEDNASTARLIRMMLMDMHVAEVNVAKDGVEAQEILDQGELVVDMILCDWRMPRMTGIDLLKQVRMTHPDTPFMMVTANADVESIKTAGGLGVSGYIAKPFSPGQLKQKIVAILDTN